MSKTIRFHYFSILGAPITEPIIIKTKFGTGEALYNMSLGISGVNRDGFYNFIDEHFTTKVNWTQKESQQNFIVRDMSDEEFALWCLRINSEV